MRSIKSKSAIFLIVILFSCQFVFAQGADQVKLTAQIKELFAKSELANAEKLLKDNSQASEILLNIISNEKISELGDWSSWQYFNLAEQKQGIENATKELEALSIQKNSQSIGLKSAIAYGYLRLKDTKKCIKIYEDLNKDYPDNKEIFWRLINYQMNDRNFSSVIKLLEPLVKKDPRNSPYTDTLGFAYLNSNRKKDYQKLYKGIADNEPEEAKISEAKARYAQALMELGKKREALLEWKKIVKLNPGNISAKEAIAQIYYSMGNKKAAQKEIDEIKKIDPSFESSLFDEETKLKLDK